MNKTKPKVVINTNDERPYTSIDWNQYIGTEIDVIYSNEGGIVVPQYVTSKSKLLSEDAELERLVSDFLLRARARLGPFCTIAEGGRWAIIGNKAYTSSIFTSYNINSIKLEDALPALAKTVQEALLHEKEEDLKQLVLMHTHPIANAPLSPSDIKALKLMANELGLGKEEQMRILAIPVNQKGELIFMHTLKDGFRSEK